jgi:hypothetical protein
MRGGFEVFEAGRVDEVLHADELDCPDIPSCNIHLPSVQGEVSRVRNLAFVMIEVLHGLDRQFTVKRYVQNFLRKLELPSRQAAATFHRTAFGGGEQTTIAAMQFE